MNLEPLWLLKKKKTVIAMNMETPTSVRTLQRKLYRKAKQEPDFRFDLLHDKIYRGDILNHAYDLARVHKGAPGVDGRTFEQIESQGLEECLEGVRKDLHDKTYKPQPVRRVMIAKPGGGEPVWTGGCPRTVLVFIFLPPPS